MHLPYTTQKLSTSPRYKVFSIVTDSLSLIVNYYCKLGLVGFEKQIYGNVT